MLVDKLGLGNNLCGPRWTLCGLWADATKSESGKGDKTLALGLTKLHAKGYMDKINPGSKLVHDQKSHQTRIWTVDSASREAMNSLESLILLGISYTPHSLILNFGELDLQVVILMFSISWRILTVLYISWLTHSSPQFYKPVEWTNFQQVHKANRAKVALALEFDEIALAVMSIDLLVQVSLCPVYHGDIIV